MFECRIGHYKRLLQWSSNQPGPQNTCGPSAPSGLRMKTMINSFGMNSFFRLTGICCFSLKAQVGKDQPMEQHAATSVYQNQTIFDSNRSLLTPALWLLRLVGFRSLIFFRTVSLRVFFLGWFLWILWPPGFLRGVRCFLTLVKELLQVPGTTGGWKNGSNLFSVCPWPSEIDPIQNGVSTWSFQFQLRTWDGCFAPGLHLASHCFRAPWMHLWQSWTSSSDGMRKTFIEVVKYPDGQDIVSKQCYFPAATGVPCVRVAAFIFFSASL